MNRIAFLLFRRLPGRCGIALGLLGLACGEAAVEPTGGLDLQIEGLEAGADADVRVTGPDDFSRLVTQSGLLAELAPGSYNIIAGTIAVAGTVYVPSAPIQTGSVNTGAVATITVRYATATASPFDGLNLRIDGLYLTQAIQRYDGSVPLVAGRDAFLRVFGVSSRSARVKPDVLVQLYHGTTPVLSYPLRLKADSVLTSPSQATLATSWNVMIPGQFVIPGLRVQAMIDPDQIIPETSESDNLWPVDGNLHLVPVRAVTDFRVRFVPVLQQATGLSGSVTPATAEKFLADVRVLLPVAGYETDVRAPYTSNGPALEPDNGNDAWGALLSELHALKRADRDSRYYYGVVKPPYTDGVGGIGFVGGAARVALGWDRLPSGAYVMAHELAHNMGRTHAPCGVTTSDPSYPHAGGRIGVWGFDPVWLTVKNPSVWKDLTGYCNPYWVSDYSWEAMLSYRQSSASNSPPGSPGGPGLLIWGRITPDRAVLEPAFQLDEGAELPVAGPYRIEAVGADSTILFTVPFLADRVADLPTGPEEAFAVVLPVDSTLDRIVELRLIAAGKVAVQRINARAATTPVFQQDGVGSDASIRWDASSHPMILIRDRETGDVLSFARGGMVRLPLPADRITLEVSNGVRSRALRH